MMRNIFKNIALVLFVAVALLLTVRGLPGNPTPTQLNTLAWKDNGPFELSPERGRYTLLYSLVENHSFYLQPDLAKFTAPDVGYINNHYVSIFAPSVSFLAIPGYVIGKYFNLAQVGAFAWMTLFALLNVILIRAIAIRLGAHPLAATIAGLTFLFATPSFPYAVTIYEHQPSTFLLLLSFYLLIRFKSIYSLFAIWILYAFAFTVDYPNLFIMLPIAVAAFFKSFNLEKIHKKVVVHISFPRIFTVLGVVIPLAFLLWVNQQSYHSPLRISGTVPTVESVSNSGKPIFLSTLEQAQLKKSKAPTNVPPPSALTFFNPRDMLNGFYILLISPDRGILVYAPVVLFGLAGIIYAGKRKEKYVPVLAGVIGFNFILYSMWGDPYGGWAFGGRYLIPAYAILSIYVGLLLSWFGRKNLLLLLFFITFSYSVVINTLGAVTSNSNPPQIQAAALSEQLHQRVDYTFIRNFNDLNNNVSKSFIFQTYGINRITAWDYYTYVAFFILGVCSLFIISFYVDMRKKIKREGRHAV